MVCSKYNKGRGKKPGKVVNMKTIEVYNENRSLIATFTADRVQYHDENIVFTIGSSGCFVTFPADKITYVRVSEPYKYPRFISVSDIMEVSEIAYEVIL